MWRIIERNHIHTILLGLVTLQLHFPSKQILSFCWPPWEALLKRGRRSEVRQWAVASSPSPASQRSPLSACKGTVLKLATVQFMNGLRLWKEWPARSSGTELKCNWGHKHPVKEPCPINLLYKFWNLPVIELWKVPKCSIIINPLSAYLYIHVCHIST